jgi:uncharacterized protein YbdZ (MbtH family)
MNSDSDNDDTIYTVVVNHEGQYSIWPSHRDLPRGWNSAGRTGRKGECLEYIESVWKDMRPLSLRKQMQEIRDKRAAGQETVAQDRAVPEEWSRGPSLVERLSSGRHPVEAALRGEKTAATLKECVDRQFVSIRFTQTLGSTELGMKLDKAASVIHLADFDNGKGTVHLEGELTLNDTNVRCVVDLDLATLCGEGHLVRRAEGSN